MSMTRLSLLCLMTSSALATSVLVVNPTGLPVYPSLTGASMEDRVKTDALGHWCIHVNASSSDSLQAVEEWYRHALFKASETDLRHDEDYRVYASLDGIKLSVDLDFVAVYKVTRAAPTSIDITRCSPRR
jgi:hypothetical protein